MELKTARQLHPKPNQSKHFEIRSIESWKWTMEIKTVRQSRIHLNEPSHDQVHTRPKNVILKRHTERRLTQNDGRSTLHQ